MMKLQLERDESEETVAHYTMGAGLEAMRRETSSFYHYNHLGTALALTGADEAVSDTYRHDAWGVLLASTGRTINPHTYVGRERYYRMPNAAMYHLGFRDYAQGLGRFTTVDPKRDGVNWFAYLVNRAMAEVDPTGRWRSEWWDYVSDAFNQEPQCKPEHENLPRDRRDMFRALVRCIVKGESADNPNEVNERTGDYGLCQINKEEWLENEERTWETWVGLWDPVVTPWYCDMGWASPQKNLTFCVKLLCDVLYKYNPETGRHDLPEPERGKW